MLPLTRVLFLSEEDLSSRDPAQDRKQALKWQENGGKITYFLTFRLQLCYT